MPRISADGEEGANWTLRSRAHERGLPIPEPAADFQVRVVRVSRNFIANQQSYTLCHPILFQFGAMDTDCIRGHTDARAAGEKGRCDPLGSEQEMYCLLGRERGKGKGNVTRRTSQEAMRKGRIVDRPSLFREDCSDLTNPIYKWHISTSIRWTCLKT